MQSLVPFQLASVCHPAQNHTVLTVLIYCSKEGMRSRFIPVNIHVSGLQATFGLLSLYPLNPDYVESLNECVNNQNLNYVFYSSSHINFGYTACIGVGLGLETTAVHFPKHCLAFVK